MPKIISSMKINKTLSTTAIGTIKFKIFRDVELSLSDFAPHLERFYFNERVRRRIDIYAITMFADMIVACKNGMSNSNDSCIWLKQIVLHL